MVKLSPSASHRENGHEIRGVRDEVSWSPAESRNIVAPAVNAQFAHFAAECVRVEVKNFCRSLWSIDHSRSSIQSGQDVIAFHVLEAREESFRRPGSVLRNGGNSFWRFGAKVAQRGGSGKKPRGNRET